MPSGCCRCRRRRAREESEVAPREGDEESTNWRVLSRGYSCNLVDGVGRLIPRFVQLPVEVEKWWMV